VSEPTAPFGRRALARIVPPVLFGAGLLVSGGLPMAPAGKLLLAALLLVDATLLTAAATDHSLLLTLRARERARSAADAARWVDAAAPAQAALAWLLALAVAASACPHRTPAAWLACLLGGAALSAAWHVAMARAPGAAHLAERALEPCVRRWRPVLGALAAALTPAEPSAGATEPASERDLAEAIEVSGQEGDLSLAQSELLRRELDFARRRAADVMVPWARVEVLPADLPFAEAGRRMAASRHSRFPVMAAGHVLAVLHARDLLASALDLPPPTVGELVRHTAAPPTVSAGAPLEEVLAHLKRRHASLAVVREEGGRAVGLVAVEDLVEELVGEIVDESDAGVVRERLVCDGHHTLRELAEHGIELPGAPDATVAEFLAEQLGELPAADHAWTAAGVTLRVEALDADGNIDEVRVDWLLAGHGARGDGP
jgi:putative hemolysin